jgi:hypothetical protein
MSLFNIEFVIRLFVWGIFPAAFGFGPNAAWALLYCLASPLSWVVLRSPLRFFPLTTQIRTPHLLPKDFPGD